MTHLRALTASDAEMAAQPDQSVRSDTLVLAKSAVVA
jgi:hypothetical protein